ncbi:hypothetical protein K5Y32_07395 [Pantoea sp. DY-15]|uniref:hypothetical protein n=1 Tax=Pantoea sp. DY-15 TaxID=2871489 RepID=UPI001C96E81D|nr:hypothetical protein [Pantoea sp. DY-15]MBY4887757.1 hypothetical protein [Pantoea sp. DY-15]
MMTEEQHLANALTAFIGRPLDNPLSRSEIMETARIALAALTQPARPDLKLPDGWVAVPREATREMIESGWTYHLITKDPSAKGIWACMIAAAPAAPHTAPIEPICATGGAEWVKVPREPTQKMIDAHMDGMVKGGAMTAYRQMLAAADELSN